MSHPESSKTKSLSCGRVYGVPKSLAPPSVVRPVTATGYCQSSYGVVGPCPGGPEWVSLLPGRSRHTPRRSETVDEPWKERPVSEGTRGRQGGEGIDDYSTSDGNTATVENDKSPKGLLGSLLDLDILPSPESDTTTLESGDSGDHQG